MVRACVLIGIALATGCIRSAATSCSTGLCPDGTACATVTFGAGPRELCVQPGQLESCRGQPDQAPCTFVGGGETCHDGVCLPDVCGNDLVDTGEACDGGNTKSGDGCSSDCRSTEVCGNQILDQITGEQCDPQDGVTISHDGCASSCRLETPQWKHLAVLGARTSAAMTYDGRARRIVMFGGLTFGIDNTSLLDETWAWDGVRWSQPATQITPVARRGHAMAYDPIRHRTIMFGGDASDTWAWDEHGWSLLATTTSPPPRHNTVMVYDDAHQRIVLFGGTRDDQKVFDDTWAWSGDTWTELDAPGPPARQQAAIAYDPVRQVVVMFGGVDGATQLGDVWELDDTTWTEKHPTGPVPTARSLAAMAYDPVGKHVLLVGGNATPNEVWQWDGTSWLRLADTAGNFTSHVMATDPLRARLVAVDTTSTVYEWDGAKWQVPRAAPTELQGRYLTAVATDPRHQSILVFGGDSSTLNGQRTTLADTSVWDGSWRFLTGSPAPPSRDTHAMAYDQLRDQFVMFGGADQNDAELDDTWIWSNDQWAQRGTGMPSARRGHAMAWDGVRGRVLLFGGRAAGTTLADTWSWDGAIWTLDATTGPANRDMSAMAWDPIARRVVLFGGQADDGTPFADTWIWDGASWTIGPDGPSARAAAGLAWDAPRRKLVLSGGITRNQIKSDSWELGATWDLLPAASIPTQRRFAGFTAAHDGAGVVMIGGYVPPPHLFAGAQALGEIWRLRWDGPGVAEESCTLVDTDGDGLAGCADPDCWPTCTPLCPIGVVGCISDPRCGDGTCDPALERCDSCPADCGPCAVP